MVDRSQLAAGSWQQLNYETDSKQLAASSKSKFRKTVGRWQKAGNSNSDKENVEQLALPRWFLEFGAELFR